MKALKDAHRTHRIMASKALSNQVATKWQDSFNRLNRVAPGISGLMEFSKVRRPFVSRWMGFLCSTWRHRALFIFSRPGQSPQNLSGRGSSGRLRKTLVSLCALCDALRVVLNACAYTAWTDTHEVRNAFDVLMQCRMLPMLLESFVGTFLHRHVSRA